MKKNVFLYMIVCATLIFTSCGNRSGNRDDQQNKGDNIENDNATLYKQASEKLYDLSLAMRKIDMEGSKENIEKVMKIYDELEFTYDEETANAEDVRKYKELQFQIDSVKTVADKKVGDRIKFIRKTIFHEQDHLLTESETIPFYLKKGEKLFINFETQGNVSVYLYNADSHSTLKTYKGKRSIHDSLAIKNSAIYLVEMKPSGNPYIDISLEKSVTSWTDYSSKEVKINEERTPCSAKDFGAKANSGIKIVNVFEEPREVTLRSRAKTLLSGNSRSVVAMQIPAGSSDVLYNLRISTSQDGHSDDGKFCKEMDAAYKEIKIMGKTVYEKNTSSTNILREMLNYSEPYREEEAYCNLYVFTDAKSAKQFGEGTPVSNLKYDVNLSKQGTQSCNDRIEIPKGVRTLYFGFENTRFRYSVYLWLESLATKPVTEYYRVAYTTDE